MISANEQLPLVHFVATGGTIANTSGGRLAIEDVIGEVPELAGAARYAVTHTSRVGSAQLRPRDWLDIARAVAAAAADDAVTGIVVTHGTFTNEETAYFLHLTIPTEKPIVVVSSQRKHGTVGNDGDRNLIDAVRLAGSSAARGHGVVTLLNEDIHSAREVAKTSARPDGFRSRDAGVLGHVDTDQITFYRKTTRRHTAGSEFDIGRVDGLPRVDIVYAYPGADEHTVQPLLDSGKAEGLVLAGMAFSGMPAPDQVSALNRAAEGGLPIVLTNRGLEGRVPHSSDGGQLHGHGYLFGDNLSPQKARILLMVALTHTRERSDLQRIYDQY